MNPNSKPHIILASSSPRRLELLQVAGISIDVHPSNASEEIPPYLSGMPQDAVKYLAQVKAKAVVEEVLASIDANYLHESANASDGKSCAENTETAEIAEVAEIAEISPSDLPILVIGADTMVVLNCEIFGKPKNATHAKEMLRKLSGNTHVVMTGVSMWIISKAEDKNEDKSNDAQSKTKSQESQCSRENQNKKEPPDYAIGVISFVDESEVTFNKLTEMQIDEYVACGECFDKAGAYAVQGQGAKFIQQVDGNIDTVIGLPIKRMLEDYSAILGVVPQD